MTIFFFSKKKKKKKKKKSGSYIVILVVGIFVFKIQLCAKCYLTAEITFIFYINILYEREEDLYVF
jgi:flagellar basal body-associated protein FliL